VCVRGKPGHSRGVGHDEAVLVVVSGLPAVGKSELADGLGRRLGAAVLSVDPIEAALWRCGIAPSFETGVAAYEVVAVLAEHQLRLGLTVIADAVSSLEVARDMWRRAASRTGAAMRVVEVVCSNEGTHRERLARRARGIDGFPEPSWEDVVRRRDEWEPWRDERLVVDSLRELDENVTEALAFVNR
jgi:predicted kinase